PASRSWSPFSPSTCWATACATSSTPAATDPQLTRDPFTGGTPMTIDRGHPAGRAPSRRQLLQAGGLALGALAVGRPAAAQSPRSGGAPPPPPGPPGPRGAPPPPPP